MTMNDAQAVPSVPPNSATRSRRAVDGLLLAYGRHVPFDQGKSRVLKHLSPHDRVVDFRAPSGIRYRLDLSDHVMREIYQRGVYERNTIRHLLRLAAPTDTFVDVGANVGAYSIPLSKRLSQGRVYSFEPNPPALAYLHENIRGNEATNITVQELGLSDRDESAVLHGSRLTTASINKHLDSDVRTEIKLTTLDKACAALGLTEVDLLKIDIEGHEWKCLDGAGEIISSSPNMILVLEIDDNCLKVGTRKEDLFEKVMAMGFRAFLPRGFPFPLREIDAIDSSHTDNIIFVKEQRAARLKHASILDGLRGSSRQKAR